MTQRERQILRWIEEDPMISQQELADKAGITRSSAAVHISNLMKKGHIAGRGYIVRTAPYAVVAGGVNMDIGGRSCEGLIPRDSNPGQVRMSLGGVGRNIAHNMALLWPPPAESWGLTSAMPSRCPAALPLPTSILPVPPGTWSWRWRTWRSMST